MKQSALGMLLKRHLISRIHLANQVGVSLQTIDNWCTRRVGIPTGQLQRLAEILQQEGVPSAHISDLILGELAAQGLNVTQFVRELGQTPRIRAVRPKKVLVLSWDMSGPSLYGELGRSCREALEQMGFQAFVQDCCAMHHLKHLYLREALHADYDAVLLIGVPGDLPDPDDELLAAIEPFARSSRPVVLARPWFENTSLIPGTAMIGWDTKKLVDIIIKTLTQFGHRRIGGILPGAGLAYGLVQQAFAQGVTNGSADLQAGGTVFVAGKSFEMSETKELLDSCTGLLVTLPGLAPLATACYEMNRTWPDDISIITIATAGHVLRLGPKPFTFAAFPSREVSRKAALLVARMINGDIPVGPEQFTINHWEHLAIEHLDSGSVGPPRID